MIGIITAMGRKIERDREALLAGSEIAAIERVGILRRGKTRILAHGPRLVDVHGRIRTTQERREAGHCFDMVEAGAIGFRVDRFHRDFFRRHPGLATVRRAGRRR